MPIRKRELASYLLLHSYGKDSMSLDEARKILELILPRRSVRSVIRILARSGFIEVDKRGIKIHRPEDALRNYLSHYIRSRVERNARSRHIQHSIEKRADGGERIYISWAECKGTSIRIGDVEIIC